MVDVLVEDLLMSVIRRKVCILGVIGGCDLEVI